MSASGTKEWQALGAGDRQQPHKSRAASALERAILDLLQRHAAPDIAGAWLDFRDASREPLWISVDHESAKP